MYLLVSTRRQGYKQDTQEQDEGQCEDWMIEGMGITNGAVKDPSRKLVAKWGLDVYSNFPQTARNARLKNGMNDFN
jgi:hypothetical protein